jgi:L-lactate dehydrogenase complex protein LldG
MTKAREEILAKLKSARRRDNPARPPAPRLSELSWTSERMLEEFVHNLEAQTAVVHRTKNYDEAADKLAEVMKTEGVKRAAISNDGVVQRLDLPQWGKKHYVEILCPVDYPERKHFKAMIFDEAEAGVTGVDFAIAESGTLCLIHDSNQPRLVSLAPLIHIALLPLERLYPVYEDAIDRIFGSKENLPSQVTLITGPSMTADIQGVPFKGMHGPKRLVVIIIGM